MKNSFRICLALGFLLSNAHADIGPWTYIEIDNSRTSDAWPGAGHQHWLGLSAGYIDSDGYIYIMGRVDDVINVAGHRLSTGAMEEIIATHPDVAECAVIGMADGLKGQLPLGIVVLKAGTDKDPDIIVNTLTTMVREIIGAVASFKKAVIVKALPKTRSGKILRSTMRKIADGQDYKIPYH